MFDVNFARRLAEENASARNLDTESADAVFDVRMRLPHFDRAVGEQTTIAMHGPRDRIWQGTGANITADHDGTIVHYISRPGVVEEKYGSADPYILKKLGWSIMLHALGEPAPDTPHGYGITKLLLKSRGLIAPDAGLHLGSTYIQLHKGTVMHGSASGTLVEKLVDDEFQSDVFYARKAEKDKAHGLYKWLLDRRAGLYDVIFAQQVITALTKGIKNLEGQSFRLPNPVLYQDIDIN